jgi:hypothetical protein
MNTNRYFAITLISLMLLTFVSAYDSIGQRQNAQVGEPYIISQPCATCTYINISIMNKDGIELENAEMSNNGTTWTYLFTPNDTLRYDVNGLGDKDGSPDSFAFWFEATLSGGQNNMTLVISDIFLIIIIMLLIFVIHNKYSKVSYKETNQKISEAHSGNWGRTFIKTLGNNFMRNSFLWYYSLGWLLLIVLKDLVYNFNSLEVYTFFLLCLDIYSFGMFLIIIVWIGILINHFSMITDMIGDMDLGVER